VIVEGSEHWKIFGKGVALHGHKTSCGAELIASFDDVQHDQEGGGAEAQAAAAALVRQHQASQVSERPHDELEYYFIAIRDDGSPANLAYRIDADGEMLHEGMLNAEGQTAALPMSMNGDVTFWTPMA
jgi:hypothetical protein